MAGYIRQDVGNNIENDQLADASYLDQEYDAIAAAFNSSSGHKHDGTSAEGGPITVIGPGQDFVASSSLLRPKTDNVYDLGSASFEFKDAYFQGAVSVGTVVGTVVNTFQAFADAVTTPSYTWVGDLDTGMYRPGTNQIGFATAGVERLTIGAAGTVAIAGVLTVGGNLTVTGVINGEIFGNADTASELETPRNIALSGGATGTGTPFDGSANITIPVTSLNAGHLLTGVVPNARISGNYTNFTAITVSGTATLGDIDATLAELGNTKFSASDIYNVSTSSGVKVSGGSASGAGGSVQLYGQSHPSFANQSFYDADVHTFRNVGADTTLMVLDETDLSIFVNFETTGDIQSEGVRLTDSEILNATSTSSFVRISGGSSANNGGHITLFGSTHSTNDNEVAVDANTIRLRSVGGSNYLVLNGSELLVGTNLGINFAGTGAATTRTNLGLGSMAVLNNGTGTSDFRNNSANDGRFLRVSQDLGDISNITTARTNLGLGSIATQDEGTAGANFRDNTANDARFHRKGIDTLDAGDLPDTAAGSTWVRERAAASIVGQVGTSATLRYSGGGDLAPGDEVSSDLFYSNANADVGPAAAGTWICMGIVSGSDDQRATTFLRTA